MAERMVARRSPVSAVGVSYVCAMLLALTTCAKAADFDDSMYRSKPISAFVRRSLESRLTEMPSSREYYPHLVMNSNSVSGQVRRIAASVNCASNPNICNDVATYGAGATCCASSGACVQLDTDTSNCGFCMYACAPGLGCCSGTCTSIMTDTLNCGTCGKVCSKSLCSNGLCGYGG